MAAKREALLGQWQPDDESELTPARIKQIRNLIRDQAHDPAQARRLLALFASQRREAINRHAMGELVAYLCDAFEEYLRNPKKGSLERALGLLAPKHRALELKLTHFRGHLIVVEGGVLWARQGRRTRRHFGSS